MQKKKRRISIFERIRRAFLTPEERQSEISNTRGHQRWAQGWKRNATFKGKPLTRSMIRRVGSREKALKLGLIKA